MAAKALTFHRESPCADGAGIAARTSQTVGDGAKTATVPARSIVSEGEKYVAAGLDPMELKRGSDPAVDSTVAELKKSTRRWARSATMRLPTKTAT